MKSRLIFSIAFILAILPLGVSAQSRKGNAEVPAPSLQNVLMRSVDGNTKELSSLLAIRPEMPLGPVDVLREYENEMTMVMQRMTYEMDNIAQAVRNGQIAREQAEYLIQQKYQVAAMQYQVLSALHETLARDVAQAAAAAGQPAAKAARDTAVMVNPPFPAPLQGQ